MCNDILLKIGLCQSGCNSCEMLDNEGVMGGDLPVTYGPSISTLTG